MIQIRFVKAALEVTYGPFGRLSFIDGAVSGVTEDGTRVPVADIVGKGFHVGGQKFDTVVVSEIGFEPIPATKVTRAKAVVTTQGTVKAEAPKVAGNSRVADKEKAEKARSAAAEAKARYRAKKKAEAAAAAGGAQPLPPAEPEPDPGAVPKGALTGAPAGTLPAVPDVTMEEEEPAE